MEGEVRCRQRGLALAMSLLLLLLFSLVAATLAQTGLLELRIAANSEASSDARQRSLALVDALLEEPGNFPARGGPGYRFCAKGDAIGSCDEFGLVVPAAVLERMQPIRYRVERVGPLRAPLPSVQETLASSAVVFAATRFEIIVSPATDRADAGEVVQGILVRIPRGQP